MKQSKLETVKDIHERLTNELRNEKTSPGLVAKCLVELCVVLERHFEAEAFK